MLDEISYQALSRFQVLEEPLQIPPHKCCGCGRHSSGNPNDPLRFIDMGFEIEFLGQAFICVQGCFKESMNQLGVLTREQSLRVEAKLAEIEAENKKLAAENKEFKDAMGSITRAVHLGIVQSNPVPVAREENKSVVPPRVNQKSVGGKKGSVEQTNERGSSNVSDHESDELLGGI